MPLRHYRRRRLAMKESYDDTDSDDVLSPEEEKINKLKKDLAKVRRERTVLKKKVKALEEKIEEMEADYDRWDILDFGQ